MVPDLGLPNYVLEHIARWGDRPALVDGAVRADAAEAADGSTLTYRELATSVGAVAARLAAAGVVRGDTVALSASNQPAWAAAFYGILAAGATAVPLSPLLIADEARTLVAAAGAGVLVSDGRTGPLAEAAARWPVATISLAALTAPPAPAPPAPPSAQPAPAPVNCGGGGGRPGPALHGNATAVVAFSSGTTGLPKGVRLTHRNLVAALVQHEPIYHVGPEDVVLAALPFCHIYGLSIVLGYALRHGATVVTMPRFDLARYLALVAEHRVTWLHLVPPLALALASPAAAGTDLTSVRHAVSGAAPLDPALAARTATVLGCPVGQGYGMTEASPGITWVPDDGSVACAPGSVGVLVPGTEARLVDPVSGEDTGGSGELWVRGPQVMAGYLDDPAATAATLAGGEWLRTG
ncbi:MAG: class I adenylate-forming enzyme family protein, partial [Acidimicrobiales bacterium]